MGLPAIGGGRGDGAFESKAIAFALSIIVLIPLMFVLFVPSYSEDNEWAEEIESIEQQYYAQTGTHSTSEKNIWTLTGIYTPYEGTSFGYTADGWLYGTKVTSNTPTQYDVWPDTLSVKQCPVNGLWYYTSVPSNQKDAITTLTAEQIEKGDTKGGTVYSSVTFDEEHKSNIYFTTSSKVTTDKGYYYQYSGYRYVFQPLSDYYTTIGGQTEKINSNSTSLSLIWYKYAAGLSGIAGQLAISGSDTGVSYLTSTDIIRAFNDATYSSTFDMTFNSVLMHLVIRLDPSQLANGRSIADCYDNGYWSVMVYSDAVTDSMATTNYEFSAENILQTLISLFTFKIADEYNIDGWVGMIASFMVTAPLYVALLAIVLNHPELWMFVLILAAIQAITTFGGFFG